MLERQIEMAFHFDPFKTYLLLKEPTNLKGYRFLIFLFEIQYMFLYISPSSKML
jgi:hypothetical protein